MGTRILKVDTFGTLTIYAGNGVGGYTGDGGAATAAGIGSNGQIAIDADNNMYIAEASSTHSIIRKINAAGIISTVAGNGSKGFSGDGGPATAAKLNEASGVFPDNCGNFYISDLYNNRIRKVDGHGIINTIAGNGYGAGGPPSNGGYSGDGGPALAAELYSPGIIYLDKNSNIYIADVYNYRVRKITMDSCKSVMGVASPGLSKGEEVLSVFPNPNSGTFTINVLSNVAEKVDVVITNVVGVRVKELSLVTNREQEVKLNVPAGVYFISAATPNGKIIKRILVD